jgi:hypothetical protein
MTVASTTSKSGPYNGNGVTVNFAVSFKYTATADVDVIVTSAAGVETTKTITTHYTLTAPGDTGTVTFLTAPASGETVTIVRTMDMTQSTDYTAGGGLSSGTVEATDDRQLMQIQEIAERVSRAPKLRQSTASATPIFPEPVANNLIGWNSGGTDLMNVSSVVPTANVSAFIETLLDDTNAATARTTLGCGSGDSPAFVNETLTGYLDLTEIAAPSSPAVNAARIYSVDDGSGNTTLAMKGSAGDMVPLAAGCSFSFSPNSTITGAQLQAVCNTMSSKGGTIFVPCKATINITDQSVTIPQNVELRGEKAPLGHITPSNIANFGPRINIGSSFTLTLNNASAVKNFAIFRNGLTFNPTAAQVASTFVGTAITLADGSTEHPTTFVVTKSAGP